MHIEHIIPELIEVYQSNSIECFMFHFICNIPEKNQCLNHSYRHFQNGQLISCPNSTVCTLLGRKQWTLLRVCSRADKHWDILPQNMLWPSYMPSVFVNKPVFQRQYITILCYESPEFKSGFIIIKAKIAYKQPINPS